MPADTDKLMAKTERDEFAERGWYAEQAGSLHEGVAIVQSAYVEFIEAARTDDIQTAYTAWRKLEQAKAQQAQWSFLVHRKLDVTRIKAEQHELHEKLAWADRKRAGLAGRQNRGEAERLKLQEWEEEAAKLREQIERLAKLEKLSGDPQTLPPVSQQRGVGDFSKALQTALNKVVKDGADAYVRDRLADLNKALSR